MRPVLLLWLVPALLAQALDDAARELARKLAPVARGAPSLSVASVPPGVDAAEVRRVMRLALGGVGVKLAEGPAEVEIRLTVSENWKARLLVAEARRGEEYNVFIAEWPRPGAAPRPPPVTLSRSLLRAQQEPILDAAAMADGTLAVLEPARLAFYGTVNAVLPLPAAPVRDPRGRLALEGSAVRAYLPGITCRGPELACTPGEAAWPLDAGAQAPFRSGRNCFDGPVNSPGGVYKKLPPFYSAALSGKFWVFTGVDGRAGIYSEALEPAGSVAALGSEVAATACGLLATRAGEQQTDALQAFEIAPGAATPLSEPLEFSGVITALWPAGKDAAVAVVKDANSGEYAAYRVVVACGR